MKKIWLIAGIVLVLLFGTALCASANEYTLPQSAVPPTIDGIIEENEWGQMVDGTWVGSYHNYMTSTQGVVFSSLNFEIPGNASFDVYVTWFYDGSVERSGLYFCIDAHDTSLGWGYSVEEVPKWGISPWYCDDADKACILIDPYYFHTDGNVGCLLFSLFPWSMVTVEGDPILFDQNYLKFPTADQAKLAAKANIIDAGNDKKKLNGYVMEFFVSFDAMTVGADQVGHDIGDMLGIGISVHDSQSSLLSYYATDFGVSDVNLFTSAFNCRYYNTVILGDIEFYPDSYVEVNRSAYVELLKKADLLLMNSAEYTDESVEMLKDVLKETSNYIYNVQQNVMNEYTAKLSEALTKMVKKGYGETKSLLAIIDKLKSSDYTADSWNKLTVAKNAAASVTENNTKDEIVAAYNTLAFAYENLVFAASGEHAVDMTAVDSILAYYEDLSAQKSKYTVDSWTAYENTVAALSAMTKAANVQSEFDSAVADVENARASLKRVSSLIQDGEAEETIDVVLLVYIIAVSVAVIAIILVVLSKVLKKKKETK